MKHVVRHAVAIGFAMASLAASLPAQDAASKDLMKLEDQWATAIIKKDGAAVGKLLSDDFLSLTEKGVPTSKAKMVKDVSSDSSTFVSGANSGYQTKIHGSTAIITGVFQITKKGAKTNVIERYAWTDTWMKQPDGHWLCVASQATQVK